jgi:hypothetical protein
MTSNQKGYNAQVRTAKHLEQLGFQVHTVSRPTYRNAHDIFGLWDHIAIADKPINIGGLTVPAQQTLYIQTKSSKIYGKAMLPYMDFPAPCKIIFVWQKGENGRYYLIIQQPEGTNNVHVQA